MLKIKDMSYEIVTYTSNKKKERFVRVPENTRTVIGAIVKTQKGQYKPAVFSSNRKMNKWVKNNKCKIHRIEFSGLAQLVKDSDEAKNVIKISA